MANIELVIKIPEEKYDVIKSDLYNTFPADMRAWGLEAIRNGTPLPKGHGELKDTDAIYNRIDTLNRGKNKGKYTGVLSIITCANTIIEAEK